jgi:hypothetical protein
MTNIGEPNYCALVIDDETFRKLSETAYIFSTKLINPREQSSIISLVIRATAQLEQLGFPFTKEKNTRTVSLQRPVTIHFYLHQNNFYAVMQVPSRVYTCEETTLAAILRNVIENPARQLYLRLSSIREEIVQATFDELLRDDCPPKPALPVKDVFEVTDEDEPPYKKRRTSYP